MIERADTKTRILDAAEKLFGTSGFEGVSLREITASAECNLAAVNYHFQSKDALIDAVIARRIEPVNQRRIAMLEAAGPTPTIEQILEAFLRPVFEFKEAPLGPLLGRVLSNPELFINRIFNVHLAPLARRFNLAFSQALPQLPAPEVAWRLHFAVGVMTHTLLWGHILPLISEGMCDPKNREALLQRCIVFLAAGFRAPEPQFS